MIRRLAAIVLHALADTRPEVLQPCEITYLRTHGPVEHRAKNTGGTVVAVRPLTGGAVSDERNHAA